MKALTVSALILSCGLALAGDPPSIQIAKEEIARQISRREGSGWRIVWESASKREVARAEFQVDGKGYIVRDNDLKRKFTYSALVDTDRKRTIRANYTADGSDWQERDSRQVIENRVIDRINAQYGSNSRPRITRSSSSRDRNSHRVQGEGVLSDGRKFTFDGMVDPNRGEVQRLDMNVTRGPKDPVRPTPPQTPIRNAEDAAKDAVRNKIASDYSNQFDLRYWNTSRKDAGQHQWEVTGSAEVTSVGGTKRTFTYTCFVGKRDNVVTDLKIKYDN